MKSSTSSMWLDFLMLAAGGGMLYFGAEWLVSGAAGMAVRLGVRPLLIGLTIVSYATSAPELAVSVAASLRGDSELALGNVVGSNIANVGLILGTVVLIAPPRSDAAMRGRELVVLAVGTVALPLFLFNGNIGRVEGILFLLGSFGFTWLTILWSRGRPTELEDVPVDESRSALLLAGVGLGGLVVLIGGGELFVRGAIGVAETLGVSERVIGLTVVAFGTSVPELAASVVAAIRGHSELAIGNVVGSNIFNLFLILGAAACIHPVQAALPNMVLDLGFMGALTLYLVVVLSWDRRLSRYEGVLLCASYLSFLVLLVTHV